VKIVCNSSVLITLDNAGVLHVLKDLFKEILVPKAVRKEVFGRRKLPAFVKCVEISEAIAPCSMLIANGSLLIAPFVKIKNLTPDSRSLSLAVAPTSEVPISVICLLSSVHYKNESYLLIYGRPPNV